MIWDAKKKIISTVLAALPLLILSGQPSPAQAQDGAPTEEEKKQILEAATEQLYAAEWTIQVTPMVGKKEDRKSTQDVIKLVNGKLHSEKFAKEGFEDSNVTVTVGDDRMIVVETMQRNKEDAVIFWRGELVDDVLRGVISKQAPELESVSYSFQGEQTATVKPEPEPEPEPAPAVTETSGAEEAGAEAALSETELSGNESETADASGQSAEAEKETDGNAFSDVFSFQNKD